MENKYSLISHYIAEAQQVVHERFIYSFTQYLAMESAQMIAKLRRFGSSCKIESESTKLTNYALLKYG
jgi:hypothetical protein